MIILGIDPGLARVGFGLIEADHKQIKMLDCGIIKTNKSENEGERMDEANLYVSEVRVDSGRMLKRIQPAPQGRAHRIRKRSNHVTLVVNSRVKNIKE